jgi:hypothetical protein
LRIIKPSSEAYEANLRYIAVHECLVYVEGRKLGDGRWQLLTHDLSKFSSAEFAPYSRCWRLHDHSDAARQAFEEDGAHHIKHNPHHWQHWWQYVGEFPARMPEEYVEEMVADWYAMGRQRGKRGARFRTVVPAAYHRAPPGEICSACAEILAQKLPLSG